MIKHITYVSPRPIDIKTKEILSERIPADILHLSSLLDLYPKFSDTSFHTDLVIIDIEGFYDFVGVGVYDIVNTILTLIKSTTQIINDIETKRITILAATADLNTKINILKDVLCSDVKGIFPRGPDFSIDEKEDALIHLLSGQYHIPQKIQSVLRPKKSKHHINTDIQLTPRQTQILSLIKNRGASNKAIAKILNITESTVKLHITSILKKFGVRNRTQLALFKTP